MQSRWKHEIQDIISGKGEVRHGKLVQTIASHLGNGARSGPKAENEQQNRKQETKKLIAFITANSLWFEGVPFNQYVSEGAEQRVYLKDTSTVLKLNDAIYYGTWTAYFHNLLLHNYFFPDTAYDLKGFVVENEVLYAVVQQPYIALTSYTNLTDVKSFLASNGFENTRNNDYFNAELGIILEDLHDENVLTKNQLLYFIDTVFYTTVSFWEEL